VVSLRASLWLRTPLNHRLQAALPPGIRNASVHSFSGIKFKLRHYPLGTLSQQAVGYRKQIPDTVVDIGEE
jgi:hypothetical protein